MHAEGVIGIAGPEDGATAYAARRLRARGWTVVNWGLPTETPYAARPPPRAIVTASRDTARAWRAAVPDLPIVLLADDDTTVGKDRNTVALLTPFEVVVVHQILEARLRAPAPPSFAKPRLRAARIRLGADVLDAPFGGVPRGHAFTVSGPSGAGKTLLAIQYLAHGERGLLLSDRSPAETASYAHALHLPLSEAIESGALIVLEYRDFLLPPPPATDVPPAGFAQFVEIVQSNHVRRAALDTGLPWLTASGPPDAVRAASFVRALEHTGATVLLTLPGSSGETAPRLAAVVAAEIRLCVDAHRRRTATIRDAVGGPAETPIPFVIEPGIGIRPPRGR